VKKGGRALATPEDREWAQAALCGSQGHEKKECECRFSETAIGCAHVAVPGRA
jgi:hypothetical protein